MPDPLVMFLAAFLIVVGMSHFVRPQYFERLVPPWLKATRWWVLVSGAVEILIGIGLSIEPTRGVAACAAAVLMALYFGVHVEAAIRARRNSRGSLSPPTGAVMRVIVNAFYLIWAAYVVALA